MLSGANTIGAVRSAIAAPVTSRRWLSCVSRHYATRTSIPSAFLDYQHHVAVAVPPVLACSRGTERSTEWVISWLHDFGGLFVSSGCQTIRRPGSCSPDL